MNKTSTIQLNLELTKTEYEGLIDALYLFSVDPDTTKKGQKTVQSIYTKIMKTRKGE